MEKFDLNKVLISFQNSIKDEDDVILEYYLKAYREVNRFFQLMGSVFTFVSNDILSKITILEDFLQDNKTQEHFKTVETLMKYEKDSNLFADEAYVSGSRTLLRLHRGLEFIYEFLQKLAVLEDNEKTSSCCKSSYNNTLAKYHPWVVRKAANVAMYALPCQGDLLRKVCIDVPRAVQELPEMLKFTKIVYDRVELLYTTHDLHWLP
ncbi:GLTPD1 family protein [Megaselia abdita]